MLITFSGDALAEGQGEYLLELQQDATLHCLDWNNCLAKIQNEWGNLPKLQPLVLEMAELVDTYFKKRGRRFICSKDPIRYGQKQIVRGFIGRDRKACNRTYEHPFQYSLRRDKKGIYHAHLNLCFVLAEPAGSFQNFLSKLGGSWEQVFSRWNKILTSTWRSTKPYQFRSSYTMLIKEKASQCGEVDRIIKLHPFNQRSDYTNWYLGDSSYYGDLNFFTLRHEVGHLFGLIDKYNSSDSHHVSRCNADVTSENEDSLMGFSGNQSSFGRSSNDWAKTKPKRKHFKQIISNVVQNNKSSSQFQNFNFTIGHE